MHTSKEVEEDLKDKANFDITLRNMREISRGYSSLEKLFRVFSWSIQVGAFSETLMSIKGH